MTKEKMITLTRYANSLKDKLSSSVPSKHASHPESYKAFLKNELRIVESALEKARLEGVADKK